MTRDPMIQVENIKMEHDNVSIQQENYLTFPQYHTDEKIFVTHTKSIVYINYLWLTLQEKICKDLVIGSWFAAG